MGQKEVQEAVNCLRSLSDYEVLCPAGSCEKLGEYCLRYEVELPEAAIPCADLEQIGHRCEDRYPGALVGDCLAVIPGREPRQIYGGTNQDKLREKDWSLRPRAKKPPDECRRFR